MTAHQVISVIVGVLAALLLAVGDHRTHTAWYQAPTERHAMQFPTMLDIANTDADDDDRFYGWDAPNFDPAELNQDGYPILTDAELAALDTDADSWGEIDDDTAEFLASVYSDELDMD
jgi:hypothetical protein